MDEERAELQRAIVLQFLKFRTSNVLERERWSDLLCEDFELLLPREPYRASPSVRRRRFPVSFS